MIKVLTKLGIKRIYVNIINVVYDKLIANIILNGEKLKPFPLKSGKQTMVYTLSTSFNIVLKFLAVR
jgi:hypothetical protein